MTTIKAGDEVREAAAKRARTATRAHYIVIPASPWGGTTGTFGPYTEAEAREWLATYLPAYTPPKLLRLVEDYATDSQED